MIVRNGCSMDVRGMEYTRGGAVILENGCIGMEDMRDRIVILCYQCHWYGRYEGSHFNPQRNVHTELVS